MSKNVYVSCLICVHTVLILSVEITQFIRDETCPGHVVSPDHCRVKVTGRSFLQCAVLCTRHDDCLYSVWDSNLQQCRLCQAVVAECCTNTNTITSVGYRRQTLCQNGGLWDGTGQSCSCAAGFTGDVCQRRIYDCSEGYQLGHPDGVYKLQPPLATTSFCAHCIMKYQGRTYLVQRTSSGLLFNRTWLQYREGFGDLRQDHWLGLQNIHLLTNNDFDFTLSVELRLQNNTYFKQYYYDFKISDETNYYRLDFSSTSPHSTYPLGDSLSQGLLLPFSTYDADHDGDVTTNCALRHQSGWWFPTTCDLTQGNPLGKLVRLNNRWSGRPEDAFWINNLGDLAVWQVHMWLTR